MPNMIQFIYEHYRNKRKLSEVLDLNTPPVKEVAKEQKPDQQANDLSE